MNSQSYLPTRIERYIPGAGGNPPIDHLLQYYFAAQYAMGKEALDIGSGEGFGSFILSKVAASVLGVEPSAEAVTRARIVYAEASNLRFEGGHVEQLQLPDAAYDLITCFGTIEFVHDPARAIQEIRRVLKPTGTLVLSFANLATYSRAFQNSRSSESQKQELGQLVDLLQSYFSSVQLLGQTASSAAVIAPISSEDLLSLEGGIQQIRFADRGTLNSRKDPLPSPPLHYVAVCSNIPVEVISEILCADFSNIAATEDELLFRRALDTPDIDTRLLRIFLEQNARLDNRDHDAQIAPGSLDAVEVAASRGREIKILRRALSNLMYEHAAKQEQFAAKFEAKQKELQESEHHVANLMQQLRVIEISTSWRALVWIQRIVSRHGWLRRLIRRVSLSLSSAGEVK